MGRLSNPSPILGAPELLLLPEPQPHRRLALALQVAAVLPCTANVVVLAGKALPAAPRVPARSEMRIILSACKLGNLQTPLVHGLVRRIEHILGLKLQFIIQKLD